MATLSTLTLTADGTVDSINLAAVGIGTGFWDRCNSTPDGGSSNYVHNISSVTATWTAWFALTNVDADFSSMLTLNIDVDVLATGFANDTCSLTARIAEADSSTTWLTDSVTVATKADTTRTQRNVAFGSLTGSKAQWDSAHILFSWAYTKQAGPDNANLRLFGLDIDGTYTPAAAGSVKQLAALGVG